MVNEGIVKRLLNNLESYVTDLRSATDIDRAAFMSDVRSQRFVERTLQMAIEGVLDIAHHIISDEGWREPASYADAFAVLAEHAVITEGMATKGELMARFRNLIVHHYGSVDRDQVYDVFANHLGDLDELVAQVRDWLPRPDPAEPRDPRSGPCG